MHEMNQGSSRDMAPNHGVKDTITHEGAEPGLPAPAEVAFPSIACLTLQP